MFPDGSQPNDHVNLVNSIIPFYYIEIFQHDGWLPMPDYSNYQNVDQSLDSQKNKIKISSTKTSYPSNFEFFFIDPGSLDCPIAET